MKLVAQGPNERSSVTQIRSWTEVGAFFDQKLLPRESPQGELEIRNAFKKTVTVDFAEDRVVGNPQRPPLINVFYMH